MCVNRTVHRFLRSRFRLLSSHIWAASSNGWASLLFSLLSQFFSIVAAAVVVVVPYKQVINLLGFDVSCWFQRPLFFLLVLLAYYSCYIHRNWRSRTFYFCGLCMRWCSMEMVQRSESIGRTTNDSRCLCARVCVCAGALAWQKSHWAIFFANEASKVICLIDRW